MQKTLLILINDEPTREAVKATLSDDYRMILTEDQDWGLSCLKNTPAVSLIICDVDPEPAKTVFWIKTVKTRHPDIPVVIITPPQGRQVTMAVLEEGVAAFVPRPFKASELRAVITSILTGQLRQ